MPKGKPIRPGMKSNDSSPEAARWSTGGAQDCFSGFRLLDPNTDADPILNEEFNAHLFHRGYQCLERTFVRHAAAPLEVGNGSGRNLGRFRKLGLRNPEPGPSRRYLPSINHKCAF
jgi:hypothetical protein